MDFLVVIFIDIFIIFNKVKVIRAGSLLCWNGFKIFIIFSMINIKSQISPKIKMSNKLQFIEESKKTSFLISQTIFYINFELNQFNVSISKS